MGRDLPLYLPGLSPTLSFASLSVKPALLSLFETFILAVSPVILRSALKAIILALLPGLEDETSDEYERTYVILNNFRAVIGREPAQEPGVEDGSRDQFFWQCLFLASITSSSRRQGALSYLTRSLPNLGGPGHPNATSLPQSGRDIARLPQEIDAVASPEPGLLIRCFDAGLRDEQLLIQRGFLELLVTHLPLHSVVLHTKVAAEDLERLVAAAVSVVVRRDMSLNRRLWTWFLGPGSSREKSDSTSLSYDQDDKIVSDPHGLERQSDYFERYGLRSLVSSIRKLLLNGSTTPLIAARPFRICLSLMDRWEIGGLIVPLILWEALESVWRYQRSAPSKESFLEVLRSAAVFFDGVESYLIWGKIFKVLQLSFHVEESQVQQVQDQLDLVHFIITHFNIQEEEMLLIHVPITALVLLISIRSHQHQLCIQQDARYFKIFRTLLTICSHLVDILPSRALPTSFSQQDNNISRPPARSGDSPAQDIVSELEQLYAGEDVGVQKITLPVPSESLARYLLENTIKMVIDEVTSLDNSSTLKMKMSIFDKIIRKFPDSEDWDLEDLLTALGQASKILASSLDESRRFERVPTILMALEALHFVLPARRWQTDYRIRQIIPDLVFSLWPHLTPSKPEYNVEAARCVFRLRKISPEIELVESSITTLMIDGQIGVRKRQLDVEAARRFMTLWNHVMLTSSDSSVHRSTFLSTTPNQEGKTRQEDISSFLLSRPVLLLIDALFDSKTEIFVLVNNWISSRSTLQM